MKNTFLEKNMPKRKLLTAALAFLPMLLLLAFRVFSNPVIDLISAVNGWHKIIPSDEYSIISIDSSNHTLWFAEFGGTQLRYYIPDKNKTFTLDTGTTIFSICVSDRTWLESVDDKIISIDPTTQLTTSYPELDVFKPHTCSMTPDGKTLFVGNELVTYDGNAFSQNYWTVERELFWAVQEPSGKTWALTKDGGIYVAEQLGSQWKEYGKVDSSIQRIRLDGNALWLGLDKNGNLYRWDLADNSRQEFVLASPDKKDLEYLLELNEVAPGIVWIATTMGVWQYQDGKIEKISSPYSVKYLYSAVFDEVLGRMYLATNRGIYYKETSQP